MTTHECIPLQTFHILGKKDFVPILEEFYFSRFQGFNSLTRLLKITPRQLSTRLKEMELLQLIEKEGDSYRLTLKGKDLGDLIQNIKGFHAKYHDGFDACAGTPCSTCVNFVQVHAHK